MVQTLRRLYGAVWFWPQQPRDLGYLAEISGLDGITVLLPDQAAYGVFLAQFQDVHAIST